MDITERKTRDSNEHVEVSPDSAHGVGDRGCAASAKSSECILVKLEYPFDLGDAFYLNSTSKKIPPSDLLGDSLHYEQTGGY
jgi:hypothetical protein